MTDTANTGPFSRHNTPPLSSAATANSSGTQTPLLSSGYATPSLSSGSVTSSASMEQVRNKLKSLPPRSLSDNLLKSMVTLSALANADKDGLFPSSKSQSSFIETLSKLPIFESVKVYIEAAPVARNAAAAKAERDAEAKREAAADAAADKAQADAGPKARFKRKQAANQAAAASPTSTLPEKNWRPFQPAAAEDAAPDAGAAGAAGVGSGDAPISGATTALLNSPDPNS